MSMGRPRASGAGTPTSSSAARLKVVSRPPLSTAIRASPIPATTASSRLRSCASSSAAWRSSTASDSIDMAMESKVSLRTPTSSSLRTEARTLRSPRWMPSAASVRRRSPEPIRSPTSRATTSASRAAPRATRNSVRNSELRVWSTTVVGSDATTASTGDPVASTLGWAARK